MVVSMVFYGLGLNVGNLAGDIYINFFLSSCAEMIGFVLPLIFLNRIGRKPVYTGGILVGGVACLLTIFVVLYGSIGELFLNSICCKNFAKHNIIKHYE